MGSLGSRADFQNGGKSMSIVRAWKGGMEMRSDVGLWWRIVGGDGRREGVKASCSNGSGRSDGSSESRKESVIPVDPSRRLSLTKSW